MEEKNSYFKSQKGITLFIFVITVIVMLTLAGMAMSYLIGPEGVLKQVEDSRIPKERQKIYETILSLAEVENDGRINIKKTLNNIEKKYDDIEYEEVEIDLKLELQVNGKRGKHKFVITTEFIKMMEGLPGGLEVGDELELDTDYDGIKEKWEVMYKNKDNIEVITKEVKGELVLGVYDSWVDWNDPKVIEEANILKENGEVSYEEDGKTLYDTSTWTVQNLSDIERAIYSYNHLKETINDYCDYLIKASKLSGIERVRSLGSTGNNNTVKYSPEKQEWEDIPENLTEEEKELRIKARELMSHVEIAESPEDTSVLNVKFWNSFQGENIFHPRQQSGEALTYNYNLSKYDKGIHFGIDSIIISEEDYSHGHAYSPRGFGYIYETGEIRVTKDTKYLTYGVAPIIRIKYDG